MKGTRKKFGRGKVTQAKKNVLLATDEANLASWQPKNRFND